MARARQPQQAGGWWRLALIFGIGGVLCTLVALWCVQALASLFARGRLLQASGAGWAAIFIGWLIAGLVGSILLRGLCRWSRRSAWRAVGGWFLGYLVLWVLGGTAVGVSLPLYIVFWLGFGLLIGLALAGRTKPAPARRQTIARGERSMIRSSQFGRIPGETVVLLTQHVRHATGPILAALPPEAQIALRDATVAAVLERTIRDWWENGNADGLVAQDITDLRSFVALAAALVGGPLDEVGQAIYRATLAALLDDWLANWNADGVDGPPARR